MLNNIFLFYTYYKKKLRGRRKNNELATVMVNPVKKERQMFFFKTKTYGLIRSWDEKK